MSGISTSARAWTCSIPRLIVSTRFISMLLSVRVGGGERRMGTGRLVGPAQGRIGGNRHRKAPRIVKLRNQADVRDRRGIAEQEGPGLGPRHLLQRGQSFLDPVPVPQVFGG